jgi:hypothetical protein
VSEELIARWLDDRASLTEDEAAELVRLLSDDPALAQQVKDQLATDELLSRRLAVDRRNFENQVAQRIVGAGTEKIFLESTLDAVRVRGGRRGGWRWRAHLPEAAAAALLIAGLFLLLRRDGATPEFTPAAPNTARQGLRAQYYKGLQLSGTPIVRVDPKVDFSWAAGQPPIAASKDVFSIRWTGTLTAKYSERYRLRARYDDGVRIWVGGKVVLDDWNGRYAVVDSPIDLDLKAGQPVVLRIEYFNGGDRGVMQLFWSSPSQREEIIPETALSYE